MKKLILVATLLIFSLALKAQQSTPPKEDEPIYAAVAVQPMFPGGLPKLFEFITKNVKPTGDKGKVFISFVVEKDGSITNIQAIRGPSEKAKSEAVRAMSLSPKWTPGTQNGRPVRVSYTLPINFE